jgi:ABC-2 type transport system permease protein
MRIEVSLFDLRLRRRLLIGYSVGMALYALVIVYLYPDFKNSTSLNQLVKNGPTAAAFFGINGSLTTPSGWLNANLYANFLPLIMLLITIGYGAACLAGQDEDGTLSLEVTLPVARQVILLQKVATLSVQAVVLALVTMLCMIVGRGFDLSIPFAHLAGASLGVALLGIDFGLLAILVGSWTGSRGTALGLTGSLAAASYLLSSLAPVVAWLRPAKYASLFYWSVGSGQLSGGLTLGSASVLVLVGAALLALSVWAFTQLDLH